MTIPEQRRALLEFAALGATPSVPDVHDWEGWLSQARFGRVVPVLYQLVRSSPTNLDDAARERIRQVQGAVMGRCVQLEHHLIAISDRFNSIGLRSAVLKGSATAHLDYPDPTWREFSDIDLLIDPHEMERARAIVEAEGWQQGYALPRFHERFTHAVTFTRDRMELDLHQRVARRAHGLLIPTEELLDRAVPLPVGASLLAALDPVDRVIHAAVHSAMAGRNVHLSSLADVLVLTHRHGDKGDEVIERAERWRVRSTVERGIDMAYSAASLELPYPWVQARRRPVRRRDRLVDRSFAGHRRRSTVDELAYLRLLHGWSDRLMYVVGHLAPGNDFASGHGGPGFVGRLRYLRRKLRT